MPWSPTRDFHHPLARITSTNAELRKLCPRKDNDMAGAGWLNQPVSEEGFGFRACESNVGSWYDKPLKDSLHLLLVGFSSILQHFQLTEATE